MRKTRPFRPGLLLLALSTAALAQAPDDQSNPTPLALADLAAYRAALARTDPGPIQPTPIRALYHQPHPHLGRFITVEGRLTRRFRQPALGQFPALVESWISSPAGNVACIVHPDVAGDEIRLGVSIRFSGTYLKPLRYDASDQARFAPLIVGGRLPSLVADSKAVKPTKSGPAGAPDWLVGLAAGGLALVLLASRMLRSRPRPRPDRTPPPDLRSAEEFPYNDPEPRDRSH